MPNGYIPAIERGSMRAGLEVRTPYLNRRLVETLSNFDQRAFIAFGRKDILKRILGRYLPKRFFDFPKKGFFTPRDAILKNIKLSDRINKIGSQQVKFIWDRKDRPDWRELALRLGTLDASCNLNEE